MKYSKLAEKVIGALEDGFRRHDFEWWFRTEREITMRDICTYLHKNDENDD